MGSLVLGIRIVLAGVFLVAGVAKLRDLPGSRRALADFGVPAPVIPAGAMLLPLLEIATAIALIPPGTARWGAVAALLLLLAFIGGIVNANLRGQAPDCHCFGQLHSAPAGRGTLVRNAALAGLAAVVVVEGPGPSMSAWVSDRTAAELIAVAAVAAALALAAVVTWLWLERRRLGDALADARAELAALPPGLPVGATAPGFALTDLHGETRTLESLRAGGRPVALVFVSPGCGPCREVFPDLGRWQGALADRLTVALISKGDPELNRPIAEEHGLDNLLLQEDSELSRAYRVQATPSAVVVTAEGMIGSPVVSSIIAIEPLIRLALRRGSHSAGAGAAGAGQALA
jgi:uncharacterized membrane protein YphA (DoxX/SURF4 family)/thiol-disulfide isomerase/thioredoxin